MLEDLPRPIQALEPTPSSRIAEEQIDLSHEGARASMGVNDVLHQQSVPKVSTPHENQTLNERKTAEYSLPQIEEAVEAEPSFESFKVAKEKWISLFERDYILAALTRSRYNISHAARESGIDRKYFRKLMNKYGIEVP